MPTYRIEVEGTAHEVYMVDAPTEDTARTWFNEGVLTNPIVLEVQGAEIIEISEVESEVTIDKQPGSLNPAAHVYDRDPE